MSNPNVPHKVTGDTLSAVELNDIVTSIGTKQDAGSGSADGILSGLSLSAVSLDVAVSSGSWRIAGVIYATTSETDLILPAADPSNNRIDLIYANNDGAIHSLTGTVAVDPVKPSLPANSIEVGFVLVTPTGTSATGAPPADYLTVSQFMTDFGDKTQLITDNKNNGVEAINEVKAQITQLDQDNVILKIIKKSNYS